MPMNRDPEAIEPQHLDAFADLTDAHILEIGSGDGRLTWRYAEKARRVTAIDPDLEELAEAIAARPQQLRDTATFTLAQAQKLPFADQTFDGVILAWSL